MKENKKIKILEVVIVCIAVLGAVFYFASKKYGTVNREKNTERINAELPVAEFPAQIKNIAEKLPDANPYDAKTNPFTETKTNPYKNVYKNPFSN